MFGSIGGPELLVIFVVALLIFGPRRLAELGRSVGRGLAEFRRAASDLRDTIDSEVARTEPSRPRDRALPEPSAKEQQGAGAADAETQDGQR